MVILDLPGAFAMSIVFCHFENFTALCDFCRLPPEVYFVSFKTIRPACNSTIVLHHCGDYCSFPCLRTHHLTRTATLELSTCTVL